MQIHTERVINQLEYSVDSLEVEFIANNSDELAVNVLRVFKSVTPEWAIAIVQAIRTGAYISGKIVLNPYESPVEITATCSVPLTTKPADVGYYSDRYVTVSCIKKISNGRVL